MSALYIFSFYKNNNEDFAYAKSINILLIRRAMRATFPDMGRLTDSPLPTTVVKTTKQFFYTANYTVAIPHY